MKIFTKRYWALLISATLVILGGFSTCTSTDSQPTEKGTHVVLIEQLTATTCGYCQYVDNELPLINGDWERVALAHTTYSSGAGYNSAINTRSAELFAIVPLQGFPTTYFDGAFQNIVGGWNGMISDLQASYDDSAARTVADIDIELSVMWLGAAEMQISIDVINNEAQTYNGHLNIYVTEIESRWPSVTGEPFVNALLAFSYDDDISIAATSTWSDTHTWDGADYGYGDITSDNIRVIAAVFDQSPPFVDEVIGAVPMTNLAPVCDFTFTPEVPEATEIVAFSDASIDSDGTIVAWNWDFGDSGSSTLENPTHSYATKGYYTVSLTVEDDDGASTTVEKTLIVTAIGEELLASQTVFDRGFPIRHTADGNWGGAQNFTPTIDTISSADIYIKKMGVPEFDLTVELRQDGPQGTLLDTVVIPATTIPTSWTWLTIDFIDTAVGAGSDVFIVLPQAPVGTTTSYGYEWGYAIGNQYDGGSFWFTRNGGGLWRDLPTMYDFVFCVYGL